MDFELRVVLAAPYLHRKLNLLLMNFYGHIGLPVSDKTLQEHAPSDHQDAREWA
jgi:hypothetical protein